MKRCSTQYIIKESQIKTAMSYHCTPIRMSRIKDTGTSECLGRIWSNRGPRSLTGGVSKWCSHFGNEFGKFLIKLNILSPYNPVPRYLPQGIGNTFTQKLARECPQQLLHNCQNLKTAKMSCRRRMDKLCYIRQRNITQPYKETSYRAVK